MGFKSALFGQLLPKRGVPIAASHTRNMLNRWRIDPVATRLEAASTENPAHPEQTLQFHKLPDRYFRHDRPDAQSLSV